NSPPTIWYSIISSSTFSSSSSSSSLHPWFFLYGLHNTYSKNHQSFAFDPISNLWFRLPSNTSFSNNNTTSAAGFLFTTAPTFSFSPILSRHISTTSPLHYSRLNPLLGVFYSSHNHNYNRRSFIVVSGVRFVGNLVDIEGRLAVEIYNPDLDSWDICPPLPFDFPTGFFFSSLSSALFKGRFYVFGINSSFVSSFNLESHVWSNDLFMWVSNCKSSWLVGQIGDFGWVCCWFVL
ncbi:F-box/kelch-repeat protein At3g24760-like, partial [Castanea sativa]|uniref:F-box/kelch-repeat protein At3g24760-like n=1 Tax=Castanea sativa TaxID=21020 RepID=UPI003F649991